MSPKPHVEIAAVIPDSEGRIVIGKRKGKSTGNGKTLNTCPETLLHPQSWKHSLVPMPPGPMCVKTHKYPKIFAISFPGLY